MINPKQKLEISGLASATLLVLGTIVAVLSDLLDLRARFPLIWLVIGGLTLSGIVACYLMWTHYQTAMQEASEGVVGDLVLGSARIDLIKKIKEMTSRRNIAEIDIGGLALRSSFFKKDSSFKIWLVAYLRGNLSTHVRIWLLNPSSKVSTMREMAERNKSVGLLDVACRESLETLRDIVLTMKREQGKRRPEVVLVDQVPICHFIFRVDGEMLVTLYLQHDTGNASPTFFLREGNPWFPIYKKQFERCFEMHRGNPYPADEELNQ